MDNKITCFRQKSISHMLSNKVTGAVFSTKTAPVITKLSTKRIINNPDSDNKYHRPQALR